VLDFSIWKNTDVDYRKYLQKWKIQKIDNIGCPYLPHACKIYHTRARRLKKGIG